MTQDSSTTIDPLRLDTIPFPQELNVPSAMTPERYRKAYALFMRLGAERLTSWLRSTLEARDVKLPTVSVVLGSGLAGLVRQVDVLAELQFAQLGLPRTSADGHAGAFVLGVLDGRTVLLQSGRLHCYENWSPAVVALPVRMQALAGIRTFVLTNAAGSLDADIRVGDVVALSGDRGAALFSPSTGLYDDPNFEGPLGPKFYSVNEVYDSNLRARFVQSARSLSYPVHEGVYQFMLGPRYEQIHEIRELVRARREAVAAGDGDYALTTVGMSTAPEAAALAQLRADARFSSIRTLGISNVTNLAAGISGSVPSSEDVVRAALLGGARIVEVLRQILPEL